MIPFNRPYLSGQELDHIQIALHKNHHLSGNGPYTHQCQQILENALGCHKAIMTPSCTDALEMAAVLLKGEPGDEVIMPSFTFVSTANAFVLLGYRPVFVDIRPDTLNLDETLIEAAITPRTRAIVVVHYAGVACEMASIQQIAQAHNLMIIEDNAHGLFASYHGKPLGSLGTFAAQSFHETKNISCGEGGALIINDPLYMERAEIIRDKGTNRSLFFQGVVDKYTWVDVGSSYLMSELAAAFLYAQLQASQMIQAKRQSIWNSYFQALTDWAVSRGVALPTVPEGCQQSYHMFYMVMPTAEDRQKFMSYLAERNINAVFHYMPLNTSQMGQKFGFAEGDCPVTEDISKRLIRLPFYNDFDEDTQKVVVEAILQYRVLG